MHRRNSKPSLLVHMGPLESSSFFVARCGKVDAIASILMLLHGYFKRLVCTGTAPRMACVFVTELVFGGYKYDFF